MTTGTGMQLCSCVVVIVVVVKVEVVVVVALVGLLYIAMLWSTLPHIGPHYKRPKHGGVTTSQVNKN